MQSKILARINSQMFAKSPFSMLGDDTLSAPAKVVGSAVHGAWTLTGEPEVLEISLREIAALAGMPRSTVGDALENLEEQGYIEIQKNDRRKNSIRLLDKLTKFAQTGGYVLCYPEPQDEEAEAVDPFSYFSDHHFVALVKAVGLSDKDKKAVFASFRKHNYSKEAASNHLTALELKLSRLHKGVEKLRDGYKNSHSAMMGFSSWGFQSPDGIVEYLQRNSKKTVKLPKASSKQTEGKAVTVNEELLRFADLLNGHNSFYLQDWSDSIRDWVANKTLNGFIDFDTTFRYYVAPERYFYRVDEDGKLQVYRAEQRANFAPAVVPSQSAER